MSARHSSGVHLGPLNRGPLVPAGLTIRIRPAQAFYGAALGLGSRHRPAVTGCLFFKARRLVLTYPQAISWNGNHDSGDMITILHLADAKEYIAIGLKGESLPAGYYVYTGRPGKNLAA